MTEIDRDEIDEGSVGRMVRPPATRLSAHVPVRFPPALIQDIRVMAEHDRKTVSAWIRDVVEAEVKRRRPRPVTTGVGIRFDVEHVPSTFETTNGLEKREPISA